MFLLPSIAIGLVFAVVLGGKPSRLLSVPLRSTWTVLLALVLQAVIFLPLGESLDEFSRGALHLGSYALLIAFAVTNLRTWPLLPVLVGMVLNATVIAANGGKMPVSASAARAVELDPGEGANVSEAAGRLRFLGDVFAIPSPLPLANVFSVGDLFLGFGMIGFIVYVSLPEGEERSLSPRRLLEPVRVAAYRRLAAGKFVSQIGDWLTLAVLIGWVYERTGSTTHVAGLLLVRLGPPIVGGTVAALVVDRLSKQRLLVFVELSRGVAVLGALGAIAVDAEPLLFVALGFSGALAAMSAAAVPALVPSLLPARQLPAANAVLGLSKDAAMAIGAVGGGLALSSVGPTPALLVDLATFALAVVLYRGVRLTQEARRPRRRDERALNGLRYMLGRRRLIFLLVAFATATLATGLTQATLPRFLEGDVGLGPGGYGYGMAAIAGGLMIGEAFVGFARVGPTGGRWIGVGLVVMAAFFGLLGFVEHAPTALLLLAAIGFIDGTTDVLFETVVQREADPSYYGCVFGFASAFMTATMTGSFVAAPVANEFLDAGLVIASAGICLAAAGTIAAIGMRRPAPAAALVPVANPSH